MISLPCHTITAVTPVVEVVTSHTKVGLGASAILYCNIMRTSPGIENYTWIHENISVMLNSNNETLNVTFSMVHFGTITCKATNAAGKAGSANVTIEQGCKYLHAISIIIILIEVKLLF